VIKENCLWHAKKKKNMSQALLMFVYALFIFLSPSLATIRGMLFHNFITYLIDNIFYHLLVTLFFSSLTMQKPTFPAILTMIVHIIYFILQSALMAFVITGNQFN
jgi:hypothetical protein